MFLTPQKSWQRREAHVFDTVHFTFIVLWFSTSFSFAWKKHFILGKCYTGTGRKNWMVLIEFVGRSICCRYKLLLQTHMENVFSVILLYFCAFPDIFCYFKLFIFQNIKFVWSWWHDDVEGDVISTRLTCFQEKKNKNQNKWRT